MSPTHGSRFLPQALDEHASTMPDRLYASIPRDRDLTSGFVDISCKDMSRCADFMTAWLVDKFGRSQTFETLAYIGIPDLRSVAIFLGAVKAGYKVLLPSPRNPPSTNHSLMDQTGCSRLLYAAEVAPVMKQLLSSNSALTCSEVPSFDDMLNSEPRHCPFLKDFEAAKNDPIVVLHSSGSTGIPKPIVMTHATFAVLDRERTLPKVPGRRNRDYSIWDFNGGGRFYTVFPYFHLAGFLSLLINPIFTEISSPVLGPPLMPPSGLLLKEVMRHQDLRALYLPPSIAEQLLLEPNGIEFFKKLDFLCYTGGPFSPSAGEKLSKVTELCPLYGSTEAFQVPQLAPAPEDWAWMEWNPVFKLEMQPSSDEPGAFELVLYADTSTEQMSALNHNMPGTSEYRTKDLFKQHPEKPGLWQYFGRRDDIIVLSNGEKFNPIPMELTIQSHPTLAGALIIGQGRSQATLLVEAKADLSSRERDEIENEIWPLVEQANRLLPAQGRILRSHILVSAPEKPFTRAGKGTIVRKLTEKLYSNEIEKLYAAHSISDPPSHKLPVLQPVTKAVFEQVDVLRFIRNIVATSFPELADIADQDDLFSRGLDSVMITQLIQALKIALKESSPSQDFSWIDTRTIYNHSSPGKLAKLLFHYLNFGTLASQNEDSSRTAQMEALITKYTQGLPPLPGVKSGSGSCRCVAIVGSTGFLGTYVVASLLANPSVETLYCLNRGTDASSRTKAALNAQDLYYPSTFSKAKFLSMQLGSPRLGLSEADLSTLTTSVDCIIYNSWKPDFTIPLSAFEKPFLMGLRSIIELCASSARGARLVFISSIAAVGDWSRVHRNQPQVPESPIQDVAVALPTGYGESKCVAERILQSAHKTVGIPIQILRVGQIGGRATNGTDWPVQEWLLSIIKTSKTIGAFPTHVAPVDWIPADILGAVVAKVATKNLTASLALKIFNAVHPDVVPWEVFIDTLVDERNICGDKLSLPKWLDRLDEAAASEKFDASALPALKFKHFLGSLGNGREDIRCESDNVKVLKGDIPSLTQGLLAVWLKGWNF